MPTESPASTTAAPAASWDFAEFCDVYEIESDFADKVASHFDQMIATASAMKQNFNSTS